MTPTKANLDWLNAAREALNGDSAFRKLGSTDMTLGLSIGDEARLVTFEAFEIVGISEISAMDLRDADIVLEMKVKTWNAYLRQRAKGKGPSLLTLDLDQRVITGRSPIDRLKLERYNLSLQAFIDKGAELAA